MVNRTGHRARRLSALTAAALAAATLVGCGGTAATSPSFRDKLILYVFLLVRLCAMAGRVYYPCHRLGA